MTDENELRDTGRNKKIPDERLHMSNARVFDTLVATTITMVRTLKIVTGVMVISGLIATLMTGFSAVILRMGQQETRELIMAISKRECVDMKTSSRKE